MASPLYNWCCVLVRPDEPVDLSPEVKRLETQLQLLQIENTELGEKNQLTEKSAQQLQTSLSEAMQEQKTLSNSVAAVSILFTCLSTLL